MSPREWWWDLGPRGRNMLRWVLVGLALVLVLGLAFQAGRGGGMGSVVCILFLAAFICAVLEALGKCPGFLPTLLLAIAGLLSCLPLH